MQQSALEQPPLYRAQTRGIEVTVTPSFLEKQSTPAQGDYFWAYTVQIINLGPRSVQLRSRVWRIVDGNGAVEAVTGAGVVGEQPHIAPGDSTSTPAAVRCARPMAP